MLPVLAPRLCRREGPAAAASEAVVSLELDSGRPALATVPRRLDDRLDMAVA